jgi:NADH dehydrogenase
MRIAIFGGTGFVGSYIIDALVEAGVQPVVLVRRGHEHRLRHADSCIAVHGDIDDDEAIMQVIGQSDAVIYNIGILREIPARDITFRALQYEAVRRVIDAAGWHGVKRFILMSANGVDAEQTAYQQTKRQAERYLIDSDLDWTIFRPSVIFGDPRGRMEFASQLRTDIVDSPLPAPLFYSGLLPLSAGDFCLSPVYVGDVARAFSTALQWPTTIGQTLELGGPASLSWREILETIAATIGKRKLMLPVPAIGVSTAAALLERFESFPITRDQLQMLLLGNTCTSDALKRLGIEPIAFDSQSLVYLNHPTEEDTAWHQNAA